MKEVIVKRLGDNRTIWISEELIGNKDLQKSRRSDFLKSVPVSLRNRNILPATGESWRWAKIDNCFYFDFDTIPSITKRKLPSEAQLLTLAAKGYSKEENTAIMKQELLQEAKADINETDLKEITDKFMFGNDRNFSFDYSAKLAEGFVVLSYIAKIRNTEGADGWRKFGFQKMKDFDEAVCNFFKEKNYPNLKISGSRQLRAKLSDFVASDNKIEMLISKKIGNQNASVVLTIDLIDEETGEVLKYSLHQTVMYGLWNGGNVELGELNKQNKTQLYSLYVDEMTRYGYGEEVMGYDCFCRHTNRWFTEMFVSSGRTGSQIYTHKIKPYVLTKGVENPMSLWVADGTGTKMVFQYKGTMRTLFRVNIFDVYSQKIVGYAIQTNLKKDAKKEESWMFVESLKMAMEQSGGRIAKEILTDNGGAFADSEVKQALQVLFPVYRTIKPGNSQANKAETLQRLVMNFCRRYENFVGTRLGVKAEHQTTNFDGLDLNNLMTFEEAVAQQAQMIEEWNNRKGADGLTPNERYFGVNNENLTSDSWGVVPSEFAVRRALGWKTEIDLSYQRGILQIVKDGIEYSYQLNLSENAEKINKLTGWKGNAKVKVYHDGKVADIYNYQDELIVSVKAVNKAFKAECEKDSLSAQGMQEQVAEIKKFEQKSIQTVEEIKQLHWSLPVSGEVTDYGFALAGKTSVKYDVQDQEEIALNEEAEEALEKNLKKQIDKEESDVEDTAFDDF